MQAPVRAHLDLPKRLGNFLKLQIDIFAAEKPKLGDIFAAEKPKLGFHGIKTYAKYSSFLNRGRYIFADWMPTHEKSKNMVTAEKWQSTVFVL